MAVHFVFRSDDQGPRDLHRRRFDEVATVLDWFRKHWRPIADYKEARQYAEGLLGAAGWFGQVFFTAHQNGVEEPPEDALDLRRLLFALDPVEHYCGEHCVQILIEDDEPDVVLYFFDDAFAAAHPEQTAYVLHEGPLPDGVGPPGFLPADVNIRAHPPLDSTPGEGRVYLCVEVRDDRSFYADLNDGAVEVINGRRLPDLCRRLMQLGEEDLEGWDRVFHELREVLFARDLAKKDAQERAFLAALREDPDDDLSWRAYADWLLERDGPPPGTRLLQLAAPRLSGGFDCDHSKNVVEVGEHVVRAYLHSADGCDLRFFFDDLWAAAHPDLANSLLRYATRWDVLTVEE